MLILAHPDIWVEIIKNKSKVVLTTNYKTIISIIANQQNKLAYNDIWRGYFETYLSNNEDETADYVDVYNNLLLDLYDNDRLSNELFFPLNNIGQFCNCFNESDNINFLIINKKETLEGISVKRGTLIIDKIDKPNRHWVYSSILLSNKSQEQKVDYRDFTSNQQIQIFIEDLLKLKNPVSNRVYIQSDYLNFGEIFDKIIGKRVTYCSSGYAGIVVKTRETLRAEKTSVSTYFGENSSYKTSTNKSFLHPRTIFYNNIIVNLNHDFPHIKIGNKNWNIGILCCSDSYIEKVRIIDEYNGL